MSARGFLFCAALALAAVAPVLPRPHAAPEPENRDFPGWPTQFENENLTALAPGPQDEWFARDFPGRIARFAAGDKQVVIRWVSAPTRRLHPASHCFAGTGHRIAARPMRVTRAGAPMSCFSASKGAETLEVCEQITDLDGGAWSDVSSWYWSALVAPAGTSWWSYVVVTRKR